MSLGQPASLPGTPATGRRFLLQFSASTSVPVQVNSDSVSGLQDQLQNLGSGNIQSLAQQLNDAGQSLRLPDPLDKSSVDVTNEMRSFETCKPSLGSPALVAL